MILRDYQQRAVNDVRVAYAQGSKAALLVSPTGSGKTITFSYICHNAANRGKRVMILVHRQELVDQIHTALTEFHVHHGFIASGYESRHSLVQVASVMSLVRRLPTTTPPDLIIIDESHHATASTYMTIIRAFPHARLLGVTATPVRLGGAGLGDIFDRLILGPSVRELTAAGHLAPARVYAPSTIDVSGVRVKMGDYVKSELADAVDKPRVVGDAIEHYQKLAPGKRAVVFCVSLKHAHHMATAAREAGIAAVEVDGSMDKTIRRRIVADFAAGRIQWLVSVDLVSEGFDCPGIECGIFLRPTQSMGLWLQQAGRCIRTAPGKTHAVLLDHAGLSLRFGLPDEDREWKLETTQDIKTRGERAPTVTVCPSCFSAQASGKPACIHCGFTFPVKSRKVRNEKGDLVEVTPEMIAKRHERQQIGMAAAQGNRARLEEIARIKGYDPRWVDHRLRASAQRRGR